MTAVSVIIPTYNRAAKVARAVGSVLDQSFRDYEIIVVDDGSRDRTREVLQHFGPRIQVLFHGENRGVSAARNTGILASHSSLIAFLDSDDHWLPDKLTTQVDFFRLHPDAVACQTEEIWLRRGRRVNPMRKHAKPSGIIFEPSLKLCLVSPSAVMLRRQVLEEVGMFDESLPACEDYDLWLRISCRYPIHLISSALLIKEGGSSDQLSATVEGLDQYRIRAMVKLIRSGTLKDHQLNAVFEELALKCGIYGRGCIKRGRVEEGDEYLRIPDLIKGEQAHRR
ncbi:MAG: glycosyl transferase [Deltaproteobacteria bacterium HGW-Deltaproteobacteria-15]|jgi:glycosyltransferase involved in cell wall biosynthesis|nr:MAG: glycosyl transferase [Deltaproteobacteria bacterium HGW-Deltaproteobacteria-15]